MADIRLDDAALRAKITAALETAGRNVGAKLVGVLQQKLNVSARVGTPGSRSARLRKARATKRRAARFLWQASAPGEAPRKRTGTLQKSVASEVSIGADELVIRVGSNVPYARFLEYGTAKMAARPWLRPGMAEAKDRLARDLAVQLGKALRR